MMELPSNSPRASKKRPNPPYDAASAQDKKTVLGGVEGLCFRRRGFEEGCVEDGARTLGGVWQWSFEAQCVRWMRPVMHMTEAIAARLGVVTVVRRRCSSHDT